MNEQGEDPKTEEPAPTVKKPAEMWAVAKGHTRKARAVTLPRTLPVVFEGKVTTPASLAGKRITSIVFVPDVHFAAAKAHEGWATGSEITEEEYDLAVVAALGVVVR